MYSVQEIKNEMHVILEHLNICEKSEHVTAGADATVYVWLLLSNSLSIANNQAYTVLRRRRFFWDNILHTSAATRCFVRSKV